EGPDLEPYRLLQTSRAREGANREPAEDFVRLLDELLRPPDDSIEDSAVSAGDDGCGGAHCTSKRATDVPRLSGSRRPKAPFSTWYAVCPARHSCTNGFAGSRT